MLPLTNSLILYPETIPNGYTNQASGTIRGREIAHSPNMKQPNFNCFHRCPVHIKMKFLSLRTTFLPGPLSTKPTKVFLTSHSMWTERSMVLDHTGTSSGCIFNFLAHHIRINNAAGFDFSQTRFHSDIHIAECQFANAVADGGTQDQASANRGTYDIAALHISNVSSPLSSFSSVY